MGLIIDFENIKDPNKKAWLLNTLRLMDIGFHQDEGRQTLDEYNDDLEAGAAEIERGEFTTTEDLKKEARKW